MSEAVYGAPHAALATVSPGAVQISPLVVGAQPIESLADASLSRVIVNAPPGTLERRYVLAHALRALQEGGELVVLAPKTLGGARLGAELTAFGCLVSEHAKRHHRICVAARPSAPLEMAKAITAGGPQQPQGLGLWSQPGVFSWDRVDTGTQVLLDTPLAFTGRGADLGCGVGLLSLSVLEGGEVTSLILLDLDARAVAAARRNVVDPRASFRHGDVRDEALANGDLEFVVMNPPFHQGGRENLGLGHAFIDAASAMLRPGGVCRLVANAALPYERRLSSAFATHRTIAQTRGYKVFEAVR